MVIGELALILAHALLQPAFETVTAILQKKRGADYLKQNVEELWDTVISFRHVLMLEHIRRETKLEVSTPAMEEIFEPD